MVYNSDCFSDIWLYCIICFYLFFFFFFQAEDGIRDKLVTGVQTCALPISSLWRRPGHVPVDTGTASVPAGLDQAALTSIVLGVAACGAGTLTSSMPLAYFASTWAASTPSGRAKFRSNAPYATSRTK